MANAAHRYVVPMPRLRVRTVLDAPPEVVWRELEDVTSHIRWMHDARAIEITSERTSGVGTTFDCETRIGPLRTVDRMEITAWDPPRRMGVRHVGLVTGSGTFTLRPGRGRRGAGRTRFEWSERLRFPWWLGGPLGVLVARPVLRRIWRRNLRALATLVTDAAR